ncbi:MAG: zinc-ribbon domain-containing protein [Candidatus Lokiarchaeota archaeon]|nr:zinc-ribbon domain-containing protein [Candidatus Lokiarchaeota archaeon]
MFNEIQNFAPQPEIQEKFIFCPNCGKKNNLNNTFCQECRT